MSLQTEETDNTTETPLKSSSRERKLTEKGQEMHNQDTKKREKTFHKTYNLETDSKGDKDKTKNPLLIRRPQ